MFKNSYRLVFIKYYIKATIFERKKYKEIFFLKKMKESIKNKNDSTQSNELLNTNLKKYKILPPLILEYNV